MEKKLFELGFRTDYKGFFYTAWILENCSLKEFLKTMQIYKKAAKAFGTSIADVERCIRYFRFKNSNIFPSSNNKIFLINLKMKLKK